MINHNKWQILQLFAGEGAGGSSGTGGEGGTGTAATGDISVDAGQQRLRELGVPENKIRKNRANRTATAPAYEGVTNTQKTEQGTKPQAAAATTEPAQTEQTPTRMSWEEITKDPEYNAELQKIIKARVKDGNQNKAILEILAPALKVLAQEHGLDPENLDHEALVKAVTGEYDNKALEMGVSKETVIKLDQQQRTLEQQKFQNHIQRLEQEGEAMRSVFPNFDLQAELQNPIFARLTSPNMGMSVEDAYYAVHRREIQAANDQVIAKRTAQQISNAIQSGSLRPDEAGSGTQAPSVTTFDYKNMTPAERKALKNRIYAAGARGEKIYPGR